MEDTPLWVDVEHILPLEDGADSPPSENGSRSLPWVGDTLPWADGAYTLPWADDAPESALLVADIQVNPPWAGGTRATPSSVGDTPVTPFSVGDIQANHP